MQDQSHRSLEEEFEIFRTVCKERGIKVTPQRLEIFRAVIGAQYHPSAEDVYNCVKDRQPNISLDTVYRTLATFEACGIVSRVQLSEDKTRFDPNRNLHHHIFCTVCKSITDFCWTNFDNVELPPEVPEWGCPKTRHVQIRGICSQCLRRSNKA
jgi:Fur family transcriptional regulator, peroxide stress response regulator